MDDWAEKAAAKLKEKGVKLTPQRLALLGVIGEIGPSHPTLTQLYIEVRKLQPTVSFSTLYNNVVKLARLGLLDLIQVGGETRIEVNTKPHVNLLEGGKVVDVEDRELIEEASKRLGRRIKYLFAVPGD